MDFAFGLGSHRDVMWCGVACDSTIPFPGVVWAKREWRSARGGEC